MSKGARSATAAGKVSIAILISRILGLVRDQFFASLFGAGLFNDAWLVALRIPGLLRDLFAEGALSSAFVPTFTNFLKQEGRRQAWHLANLVLSALLMLLGIVTLALFFFSDFFVHLLAAGFAEVPGKVEVTSTLIKILSPFLMLIAMASVAMGILNTLNHYFLPALAPAVFNLSIILFAIFVVPEFESRGILPIYAMGFGALLGGALQYAIQLPVLRREGFRLRFRVDWGHPGIRRIARLIGPAVVGVSAVQINVLVNTQLASFLQDNGPVSWLSYAFRIMYLPIGLFGVAVGVVNLKEVSAFASEGKYRDLKETVANSIKLVAFLAIPSTLGLILLARPIIDVIFERGDFLPSDTQFTAYALMTYSLGLFAYSCIKIYVPTFYALNDTRTPVRISVGAVFVNLGVNLSLILLLPEGLKYVGLAFGTAFSVTVSSLMLAARFRARMGSLGDFGVRHSIGKACLASAVMGISVYGSDLLFARMWTEMDLMREIVALVTVLVIGLMVYCVCARLLKIEELDHLSSPLRRLVSRWR